jgi:hypothetical protein
MHYHKQMKIFLVLLNVAHFNKDSTLIIYSLIFQLQIIIIKIHVFKNYI